MQIESTTIKFLKDLRQHNQKEWFDANRKRYDQARQNFAAFVQVVLDDLRKTDPTLAGLEVKQTLFRINRDVRFSKNKNPYKTNFACSLTAGGKKIARAGYYFHLEPGANFAGGGWYMPDSPAINAIRQEIDYNLPEFEKILQAKAFKKWFAGLDDFALKTRPKGFDADNPALHHLKQKSFIASAAFTDKEVMAANFSKQLADCLKALQPLIYFLNRSMD